MGTDDCKLVTNNALNTKIGEMANKTPHVSKIVSNTALNTKIVEVENKILNVIGLVTYVTLNTRIEEVGKKIPNHDEYITSIEFNKLKAENFAARLKQANLATKTDTAEFAKNRFSG